MTLSSLGWHSGAINQPDDVNDILKIIIFYEIKKRKEKKEKTVNLVGQNKQVKH